MPKEKESVTITEESGLFVRRTIRHGKKRKTEVSRIKTNDKKVVLGYLGKLQVYVYPYSYPDRVFIGEFPTSTYIDSTDVHKMLKIMNTAKWFLGSHWQNNKKCSKNVQFLKEQIKTAYSAGLNEIKDSES